MIPKLFPNIQSMDFNFLAIFLAFLITCVCMILFMNRLPQDGGRKYAVNGTLSRGKPRGAGIIFILVFTAVSLIFLPFCMEYLIYFILLICAMITGYLDDRSSTPWGEYLKGFLDLVIAVSVANTYYQYHGSQIYLQLFSKELLIPPVLFLLLATILVWASINVTNCSDGVDGLCGTLSLASLASFSIFYQKFCPGSDFQWLILLFIACLLGYLWFNVSPSRLMMGDAGSRAIGVFIALTALNSKRPFIYLALALVLIINGGIGLIKVSLLRFLKISILKNTITPLHDNLRKHHHWSDPQVVFRMTMIQILISFLYLSIAILRTV